ncbi:histidine triad family protein [Thermosulfidibacter takaii ABI70S6]|uniref:Histidine triad family protein n=1 Tax=Thermosulfidibacter takaii (strain DSM 17441 / JCM 13301 / NBRC 103674 / ABI70S6) TaxID=1298851 RepID=A0A0S3QU13_THET7|nr:HIT domain-containing protein [Thermosulfidibacter takaii]BAT71798.1 histidine triad family protein [Thermosulfidibacter takaii ABI70S6]
MKQIWAPWRIEYILSEKEDECFICKAISEGPSEENLLLYVGKTCVIIMNRYPYNPGHLMIAPNRHVGNITDLNREEHCEMMELASFTVNMLSELMKPDGFNLGINLGRVAGAGLETHVHLHVVPRWNGDTNFMPVLADVKVIPEHIRETYRKLKESIDKKFGGIK